MLNEIYLRLFAELIPNSVKVTQCDIKQLISTPKASPLAKSTYSELIKSIYKENPNSNIGLLFGKHLQPSALCDLSRAFVTADNFMQVIKLVELYHFSYGVGYYPFIHIHNGKLSLALTYPYKINTSDYQKRFCAETAISYILNYVQETMTSKIPPLEIHFDFAKPSYANDYKIWNCPVHFNHALTMITFDQQVLFQNVLTRNHVLHPVYLNKSLDEWRKLENLYEFEHRAISLMMQHHPHAFNSEYLAKLLSISVRGLQKRLSKHGESFSHLSNLAKRELCKVYLIQKQHDLEFTAEQLGFQSNSGFRRFFKQEFDQTPTEYQKCYSHFIQTNESESLNIAL
jgi:AraC-like DNA-binding protein